MIDRLRTYLTGTLRGRLILSVATVHAVMMALFIGELTLRQRSLLLDRQTEEATALSMALATSAAGWIAADDVSGLQELVEAQLQYPEVAFAVLADGNGRVLANTDASRLGMFMLDLPGETRVTVLSRTSALVDVAAPAIIGGHHVGWARVGIGQKAASDRLGVITRDGILYTVAAIVFGSVIAYFLGERISRRLRVIQKTIQAVRSGDRRARTPDIGTDEAAEMAREFNTMLDVVAERDAELRLSEERYRSLIDRVQTAIIVHDRQGRILSSNPLARELLGLTEDQLTGATLVDPRWNFVREDGSVLPVSEYPVSRVLESGGPLRGLVVGVRRPDRDTISWMIVNAEPETDAVGAIERVIVSFVDLTEHKQTEQDLKEAAAHIHDLYNRAPCGYHSLGPDGTYLQINDTELQWLGYERDEIVGKRKFSDLLTPATVQIFRDSFPVFKATGAIRDLEFEMVRKDGSLLPVVLSATAIRDTAGNFVMSRSTVFDISDRRRAEQARMAHLRFLENMDRVNRAIQGAEDLDGMMRTVLDTVIAILECDRAFLMYPCDPDSPTWRVPMERSRPEYPGASALGVDLPMDADVARTLREMLESDRPVRFGPETEHPLPEDVASQFGFRSFMSMALRPRTGKPWQFGIHQCSYARVWTEEDERLLQEVGRRLEDALTTHLSQNDLRESEERYRRIVDTATEGICVMGSDSLIAFVNGRMSELLGYPPSQIHGRPLADFLFEEDLPDHFKKLENRRTGLSETYERRFRRSNGEAVWTLASATPTFDGTHRFSGSFAMFADITETRRNTEMNEARLHLLQFAANHTLDDTLEEMLNVAERLTGSRTGFFHIVHTDQASLTLTAWSTRAQTEFGSANEKGHHAALDGTGVWADCVREQRPVIHNDCTPLPGQKGLVQGSAALTRCLVVPVLRGTGVCAIVGLGNKTIDYGTSDVETATLLGNMAWEVAERKMAEQSLNRLNRELRAISNCNQALIRAENEAALLQSICRIICDEAGYRMAWVGYAEHDDARSVRPVAVAGVDDGYLAHTRVAWSDTPEGHGPTGTAIREGRTSWIQDFSNDPLAAPWREAALDRGFRSSIALPLKDAAGTFGALNIYSSEAGAFVPEERTLLEELGGDLAFGITVLRSRRERDRAEERLSLATRAARLGVWDWDILENRLLWDDRMYELYGVRREDFGGAYEAWLAGIHPEDRAASDEISRRARAGKCDYDTEFRVLWPDGSLHHLKAYGQLVRDEAGNAIRMIGVNFDITESRRAEAERLSHIHFIESLDRITRAIEATNDLNQMMRNGLDAVLSIFECDRAWLFVPCLPDSPTFQVPMESSRPEYPGAGILNTDLPMPPDIASDLRMALEARDVVTFVEGTDRPVNPTSAEQFGVKSMMMIALHPRVGTPWAFGLHQCSTARQWSEAEKRLFREISGRISGALSSLLFLQDLQTSEERFRRLAENAPDAIYRMSLPEGRYEYVSPAVITIFGHSPSEFLGSPNLFRNLLHPDSVAYFAEQWTNLLKGEMPPVYEYRIMHRSGEVRWLNQRNILVRDEAGNPIAIEGIVTDITERKNAEEEIRKLNETLERRVEERTAALEEANRELEAFAYSVSHDLRTPLRHIDGFLGLLKKRIGPSLDEQSQHYMSTISGAALKMSSLIEDLLSFSRMGRGAMTREEVDLGDLAREVIEELGPERESRQIRWTIGDLPAVTGDRAMLRLVLNNLISNAVKFTQPRALAEIEIGCLPDDGPETVIFVRDNGVGFDMRFADRLFGVFQRLHAAEEFDGTGIGLANVRRVIARHGGRTWADAKVDQGATFFFSLPRTTP